LEDAVRLALLRNPALGSFSLEVRAKEAEAYQASLYPNPEISFEMENFAGTGTYNGFQSTETTISLGQMILLGGKRDKRTQVANLESDMTAWDYEIQRLDVFTAVTKAYISVISGQEQVKLNEELLDVAKQFAIAIEKRVSAGRLSPAELSRAKVELTNAEVALNRSQRELDAARIRLAATWNGKEPRFGKVEGDLVLPGLLPELKELTRGIKENPEMEKWVIEMEKRRADKDLQEALGIPDLNIGLGYRRLSASSDNVLVAGLSIPIPIFNSNQGAVEAAKIRVNQAEWQKASTQVALISDLNQLYASLQALRLETVALYEKGIPEAENAFEIINDGYNLGKFRFLDVLNAQRTLFESRSNLIRSLAEYQMALTDIERIIGRPITNLIND